ncbi:MAG: hypothetical protein KKA84_05305 [Bacteroidetes bacterium]|nr:hypothetical protein [Bacteroidota bacterium]
MLNKIIKKLKGIYLIKKKHGFKKQVVESRKKAFRFYIHSTNFVFILLIFVLICTLFYRYYEFINSGIENVFPDNQFLVGIIYNRYFDHLASLFLIIFIRSSLLIITYNILQPLFAIINHRTSDLVKRITVKDEDQISGYNSIFGKGFKKNVNKQRTFYIISYTICILLIFLIFFLNLDSFSIEQVRQSVYIVFFILVCNQVYGSHKNYLYVVKRLYGLEIGTRLLFYHASIGIKAIFLTLFQIVGGFYMVYIVFFRLGGYATKSIQLFFEENYKTLYYILDSKDFGFLAGAKYEKIRELFTFLNELSFSSLLDLFLFPLILLFAFLLVINVFYSLILYEKETIAATIASILLSSTINLLIDYSFDNFLSNTVNPYILNIVSFTIAFVIIKYLTVLLKEKNIPIS